MIVRKAFKFQLQVQPEQARLLSQAAGCSRFVWNRALALQNERLAAGQACLSYPKLAALLESKAASPAARLTSSPTQSAPTTTASN